MDAEGGRGRRKEYLKRLQSFTALTLSATAANFLLRLVRSSLFARILGPSNRGIFGLFSAVPSMLIDFGGLGIELGNAILVAKRRVALGVVLGNTLLFSMLMSVLMAVAGYLLLSGGVMLRDRPEIVAGYLPVIILSIPLIMLEKQGKDLLKAAAKIKEYNVLRVMFPSSAIVLFLFSYWVSREELASAVAGWLGGYAITNSWIMYCLLREAGWSVSLSWTHFRTSVLMGLRGYLSTFADELLSKFDLVLIGYFLGSTELGFYVISVALVDLILQLSGAVNDALLPLRFRLTDEEGFSFTPVVTRHVLFIMVLLCLCAAAGGRIAILLIFGVSFMPAYVPMLWLLPGVVFRSLYRILKIEMFSREKLGIVTVVSVSALVINVVLNVLLIPRAGIVGAAMSTTVANLGASAFLLVSYHGGARVPYRQVLLIRRKEVRRLGEKMQKALARGKSRVFGQS